MPLTSMTGFGRGSATRGGIRVDVEISSVNRKQFDARLNLPRPLAVLEARVQMLLETGISRGQISVNVRVAEARVAGQGVLHIDRQAAAAGVRALRRTAAALKLPDTLGAEVLLQLPGVLVVSDRAQDAERVWPAMRAAVQQALAALLAMRRREGMALARDLRTRLRELENIRRQVARRAPELQRVYERDLRKRVADAGLTSGRNDPQVLKELLFFVDKSDVSEELVRLQSHFSHAAELMASRKPVGRPLDFLCQELFREINTVGSKSMDAGLTRLVVEFKARLEAVREQVQNVE